MESEIKKRESIFASPISILRGIGAAREKLFKKLGIFTIKDLLHYYPRDYEDRSKLVRIGNLQDEETAAFIGIVTSRLKELHYGNKRHLTIQKLEISDDTSKASVIWFNQSYLKNVFKVGEKYFFYGRVKRSRNTIEIQNPVYERLQNTNCKNLLDQDINQDIDQEQLKKVSKIVPVYSTTSRLTQTVIRTAVEESLELVNGYLYDHLPVYIRERHKLSDYSYSIENIHFPCNNEALANARKRLAFEELLLLQLGLLSVKNTFSKDKKGIILSKSELTQKLVSSLPYKLTYAQLRVFDEISRDMQSGRIMNRLVQGDVGSGKTVVAVLSLVKAVENGYQGVLMVPTGILAEQHYQSITNMVKSYGIKVGLLTGNIKGKEKTKILNQIRNGDIDIVVGTHALIQDAVEYYNIGLVITDEQHRFGVMQRLSLSQKGKNPHILVMTATPIPRTLALILYGDLDISIIDEMPPGRMKIKTYAVNNSMRERINNFIRKSVSEGRQVYIVCPLVEDTENIDAKSTVTLAEDIAKKDFKDFRVGLLHGKLKPYEKEAIMKEFTEGNIDILVSTTVVEVGVDVPNATIMIVENAERFGLSQLHQLRGRVGRGKEQSYCILYNESSSEIAKERMQVMAKNNDGFVIAEKDLELRGPGEFFGIKQHGIPELKIANLYKDMELLKEAQKAAKAIIEDDPQLIKVENKTLRKIIDDIFQQFTTWMS